MTAEEFRQFVSEINNDPFFIALFSETLYNLEEATNRKDEDIIYGQTIMYKIGSVHCINAMKIKYNGLLIEEHYAILNEALMLLENINIQKVEIDRIVDKTYKLHRQYYQVLL